MMITSSVCCIRAYMKSGRAHKGHSSAKWRAAFATHPHPHLRLTPSPGRQAESQRTHLWWGAIAEAARALVEKRYAWLNPPNASAEELKKRTLTNLYNARPAWLADAHRKLDEAVSAAWGWPSTLTDAELLERLLALNHERAAAQE